MSYASNVLWYTDKQRELMDIQTQYGMAQSSSERDEIVDHQKRLIHSLNLRLKRNTTLYMRKKIITKMIIKELSYDDFK